MILRANDSNLKLYLSKPSSTILDEAYGIRSTREFCRYCDSVFESDSECNQIRTCLRALGVTNEPDVMAICRAVGTPFIPIQAKPTEESWEL